MINFFSIFEAKTYSIFFLYNYFLVPCIREVKANGKINHDCMFIICIKSHETQSNLNKCPIIFLFFYFRSTSTSKDWKRFHVPISCRKTWEYWETFSSMLVSLLLYAFFLVLNFSSYSCSKHNFGGSRYDPQVEIDYCGPWIAINVTTLPLARSGKT